MWERPGVPTWGIGPDMRIRFLNRRAEELLGTTMAKAVGRPCYEVVRGLDRSVETFCCKRCPVFAAAQSGSELTPKTLLLGRQESPQWSELLPIVVPAPDGSDPILVESAVDVDRWARIEGYMRKIAARDRVRSVVTPSLTHRETEILSLLAEGDQQSEIATRLNIHYTTVRTHVQRILTKLGVNSIHAAVSNHVLDNAFQDQE